MTKIKPNTIVHFRGNYIDDNNRPAKERRHIALEIRAGKIFFLKLTSEDKEKDLYARWVGKTDCLNKISYAILKRQVEIHISDLEISNYQNFYICNLHKNGCLKLELFEEIFRKVQELWADELMRDKKIIRVDGKKLLKTKDTMFNIGKELG